MCQATPIAPSCIYRAVFSIHVTGVTEYIALIWGTVIMALTGLVLWFPGVLTRWAPGWLVEVSEVVHFYEAWLAFLAIVVWHFFFVIFHPEEYPLNLTFMTGKVTKHKAAERDLLEFWSDLNVT